MPLSNTSSPNEPCNLPAGSLRCSVIIPVFLGGSHFPACLGAVAAALRPQDELIVIANGEGDGAWRAAERYGARLIHCAENGGPARARNLGARTASGDLLFFVDADVAIPPDAITRVAAIFSSDAELSALIGSYDDAPGEQNFHSQFKNLFHHYVHQHGAAEASTFWGACGAIRRQVFLETGGFDEDYARSSIEDIEFGYRLRAASHRIRLAHDLQVKHWKKWRALSLLRSDLRDRAMPWTELILEEWSRGRGAIASDLNLGPTYKVSLAVSFLLLAFAALSFFVPALLWSMPILLAAFLFLNLPLFQFFRRKRGWFFCLRTIGWRFAYDLCSGIGFAFGAIRFFSRAAAGAVTPGWVAARTRSASALE